jgi:hypothetical protein
MRKRLVSMLLAIALLASNAANPISAQSKDKTITFDEFYTALQNEYKIYGAILTIENPNYEFVYTQKLLDEEIENIHRIAKDMELLTKAERDEFYRSRRIHQNIENEQNEQNEQQNPENPQKVERFLNFTITENKTLTTNVYAGVVANCKWKIVCTGKVSDTTAKVQPSSIKTTQQRTGSINLLADSTYVFTDLSFNDTIVGVYLDGSIEFTYRMPVTGVVYNVVMYGLWHVGVYKALNYAPGA